MEACFDNDVLLKGACYGLIDRLVRAAPAITNQVGVLGAARFVVCGAIRKANLCTDRGTVEGRFLRFVDQAIELEPSSEELDMAAELEFQAQKLNLAMDVGESQLCAITITRNVPLLVTGDKRAIRSMEHLLRQEPRLQALGGRVKCLEQLMLSLLEEDPADVRGAVCAEPAVDKALTLSFSCSSSTASVESWAEGLRSYVGATRRDAPKTLADD